MCLTTDINAEKKFAKKYGKQKRIKVYKVLEYACGTLKGPYVNSYVYDYGINYATGLRNPRRRKRVGTYSQSRCVYAGLHCYLSQRGARDEQWYKSAFCVVTAYADPNDCLGVGEDGHAVFSKLEITKQSYNQALANIKRRYG